MRKILELNHTESRAYFLKAESYFNFDLPQYFVFQNLINEVSNQLTGLRLSDFFDTFTTIDGRINPKNPSDFENVNYSFLNNKDGKFAWRPFQLIHPALYVSLVHNMTEEANWNLIVSRFEQFNKNPKIKCYSIPLESDNLHLGKATTVTRWLQTIEQQSIELALKYEYVLHTDITDCYSSIYTHSVPWAIHTKEFAKQPSNKNNKKFIGNSIDKHLRNMSYGQTNGIPQGSVLMDFIAEIVLGYADLELSNRIPEHLEDYQIIRYRDDYRIFSNNPQDAELITKILTEILIELGMKLNSQKTLVSNNIVRDSISSDRLYYISHKNESKSIQQHLIIIHILSEKYPNSGSLSNALGKFYDRIKGLEDLNNVHVLISVIVDIMYKSPRTYPIASAILSKLFLLLNDPEKRDTILQTIMNKFEKIPNTGHIKIWLQRLTIKIDRAKVYEENLCKKVNDPSIQIWNSTWLSQNLKKIIDNAQIIDEHFIKTMDLVINPPEVQYFVNVYYEDIEE